MADASLAACVCASWFAVWTCCCVALPTQAGLLLHMPRWANALNKRSSMGGAMRGMGWCHLCACLTTTTSATDPCCCWLLQQCVPERCVAACTHAAQRTQFRKVHVGERHWPAPTGTRMRRVAMRCTFMLLINIVTMQDLDDVASSAGAHVRETLAAGRHVTLGLAVHYAVAGRDHWDNNDGSNHTFDLELD